MYTITIESYREFSQRHGNRPLAVGNEMLFADGAACSSEDADRRQEPPHDPVELIRVKLRYWREAVKRAEYDFDSAKTDFARQAALAARYANLPGPPHAKAELNRIAEAVRFCRDQVAKLEAELAEKTVADPLAAAMKFRIENELEEQRRAAELLHEIESVTI